MDFPLASQLARFFILEWAVRIFMLFVVPKRRKPTSANAWLLLIMVAPIVGALLFYMFGDPKLSKKRRALRRTFDKLTKQELTKLRTSKKALFSPIKNENVSTLARLATVLGGMPPMHGNKITILHGYSAAFEELVREIDGAKKYVHVQFFIATHDSTTAPVFRALERASKRGVVVRFLYDGVVSKRYPGQKKMRTLLQKMDAEVKIMLPLALLPGKNFSRPDLRNHRKVVVIDGKVAMSGSQNLIDKSYHRSDDLIYEDAVLFCKGPIAWHYNTIFRSDWYAETLELLSDLGEESDMPEMVGADLAQVLPSGPTYDHDNNLKFYTSMIHSAKKRVGIVVPYFVPDESLLDAMTAAAQRGVKVTMINSAMIDKFLAGYAQRSYYDELLEAGVKVYLYNKPTFLHTKQVLIDDEVAIVGSSNLDIRSFELNFELTTILYSASLVKDLEEIEADYLKNSSLVTLKKWQQRPLKNKLSERLARLTAAIQ